MSNSLSLIPEFQQLLVRHRLDDYIGINVECFHCNVDAESQHLTVRTKWLLRQSRHFICVKLNICKHDMISSFSIIIPFSLPQVGRQLR